MGVVYSCAQVSGDMKKVKLGISIGDINGIGPEVIIKSLRNKMLFKECTPIIYGSSKVLGYHKNIVKEPSFGFNNISHAGKANSDRINLINCWQENVTINLGEATEHGGKCAYIALDKAANDLMEGHIDALVTAPINKHAMKLADFPYLGHTEYLADRMEDKCEELMMLISDSLKVAVLSSHIPLQDAAAKVTKASLMSCIKTYNHSLVRDFGKERPAIAVLGLNPHAGDQGEIGTEEEEIIRPAIVESKKNGILVSGPYSADGFFGSAKFQKFDGILAMYHDQGLIPFKTISFGRGVNYTAGLKFVRTSPDHGTGYDIVGQNIADESSMRQAIYAAIDICRSRSEYDDMHQDKIEKVEIESEGEVA